MKYSDILSYCHKTHKGKMSGKIDKKKTDAGECVGGSNLVISICWRVCFPSADERRDKQLIEELP